MYRFKSIKYLSVTGFMTALLVVVGYLSSLFFIWAFGGTTTLQLFDALYLPFCAIFKGPMMLFAGAISGAIFDLVSGVRIVTIPVTILIRILMFFTVKILTIKQWWSALYSFFVAVLILMFGYPLYYVMIYHDRAVVITELIADAIQGGFAYCVAVPIYYYLHLMQVRSQQHFWNDEQFTYLKAKKKLVKEIYVGEEDANR